MRRCLSSVCGVTWGFTGTVPVSWAVFDDCVDPADKQVPVGGSVCEPQNVCPVCVVRSVSGLQTLSVRTFSGRTVEAGTDVNLCPCLGDPWEGG